jgi:adenylate cyclase
MGRRRNVYLLSALLSAFLIFPWGLTQPLLLDDLRNFVFDSFQRAALRPGRAGSRGRRRR